MIKVLVADDDVGKYRRVHEVVLGAVHDAVVRNVRSVNSALSVVAREQADLLVLDLALPMIDGGNPVEDGGRRVLEQLSRIAAAGGMHVVALTAFPDVEKSYREILRRHCVQVVTYGPDVYDWQEAISSKAKALDRARSGDGRAADVAIVCALAETELEAVRLLPASWQETRYPMVPSLVYQGRHESGAEEVEGFSLVAAAPPCMGMVPTAALTTAICHTIRPRLVAMVGIAAGLQRRDMLPGDVLVASQAFDYGAGKIERTRAGRARFLPAAEPIVLEVEIATVAQAIQTDKQFLKAMYVGYDGERPGRAPRVFIGPIASGAAVVKDSRIGKQVRARNRKSVGLEMEAYGVFAAVRFGATRRPRVLVAKSVADFGNRKKSDAFQKYAAYTSAAFCLEFVKRYAKFGWQ